MPSSPAPRTLPLWSGVAFVMAAALFAWWGVWANEYLFDDRVAIVENEALQAGHWLEAAFGATHRPVSSRPFTTLSLAVDFALYGSGPFAAHLGNLLLHLGNALLLLLVVRRAMASPNVGQPARATGVATAIAAIWAVHPLATDAVAYATQRSTLLFSGCLLLALWAALRANASGWPRAFRVLAAGATALGMASKEDMVLAPIVLVLLGRAFLVPSFAGLNTRYSYYALLAASWLLLLVCVMAGPANLTVGYATEPRISAGEWLLTQAPVVSHYLQLTVWPTPLRGAYDWDYVRALGPAWLPGLLVLGVLVATQLQWRRRPWLAWLGLSSFLLLAPTSTVLPIRSEVVAERRMYLPMLLVVVVAVVAAARALRRWPAAVSAAALVAVTVALALVTRAHAPVYRTEPQFWADAYEKRTPGSRAHLAAQILGNHAAMLFGQGQVERAHELLDEMMTCESPTTTQVLQYAASQQMRGHHDEGRRVVEDVLDLDPGNVEANEYLGIGLMLEVTGGGADSSWRPARRSLRTRPAPSLERAAEPTGGLGRARASARRDGRIDEAEGACLRAIRLAPDRLDQYANLRDVLVNAGREGRVRELLRRLGRDPEHAAIATRLLRDWFQSR